MTDLSRSRKAAAYTFSLDWQKLAYATLASGAAAHYVTPWLLAVLLPVVVQHALSAVVNAKVLFAVRDQQEAQREAFSAQLDAFLKDGKGENE
jgi:hypothetical protein